MQEINWEELWAKEFEYNQKVGRKEPRIEYWNKAADDYSDSVTGDNYEYGRKVMESLLLHEVINSNSEVLEVGPGPGTFAIPFAKRVKTVTVVEPAEEMIKHLRYNAVNAGVDNIEIINKKWEDGDLSKIAGKFDLVICSNVLWLFKDVWMQLEKMERASKGYCCVVHGTGYNKREGVINDELWNKIMGDIKKPNWSKDNILYNVLYDRGRFVNIRIITHNSQRTPGKWIKTTERHLDRVVELTPDIKRIIREHIMENSEGGIYKMTGKAAMMWWNVHDKEDENGE